MGETVRHETVLDPGAEHLGRIYAQALVAAAIKADVADTVVEQLEQVCWDVINEHPELAMAFASPRVDAKEKSKIIDRLFADKLDVTLLRFLKVVAGRGRLGQLSYIADAAREIRDEALGRLVAEVRTAVPLTDELRASIVQRLGDAWQREIVLRERVDPEIVGGLLIRVGDTVYDTSVAGRLETMAKKSRQVFARKLIETSDRFASGTPAG